MTERILKEAEGYCQLEMYDDALESLETLSDVDARTVEAMNLRLSVLSAMKNFEAGAALARHALDLHPDQLDFYVQGAWCVRRSENLEAAWELLRRAEEFCGRLSGLWFYNMACYACQRGELEAVESYFSQAVALEKAFEVMARADDDLREWVRSK